MVLAVNSAIFIILALIPAVSAEIEIHNTYYTDGATVYDDEATSGMDSATSIYIDRVSIFANGGAWSNTNDSFVDAQISLESGQGLVRGSLTAQSEDVGYSKSISAGQSNKIHMGYGIDSGKIMAGLQSPFTQALQYTELKNISYLGSINIGGENPSMGGKAMKVPANQNDTNDSSMNQNLMMVHTGKWCNILSNIFTNNSTALPNPDGDPMLTPIFRFDDSVTFYGGRYAIAGVEFNVVAGDRYTNASIYGKSTSLAPQHPWSLHVPPMPIGDFENMGINDLTKLEVTRKLFMTYKLEA